MALPRIDDLLHDDPACPYCLGEGMVCEDHPGRPWGPMVESVDAVVGLVRAESEASIDGSVRNVEWVRPDDPADALGPLGGCWCGAPGMPCPKVPG